MPTIVNLDKVKHICFRKTPNDAFKTVKKACEKGSGALVFSASQLITYKVDTGTTYTEEIEYGASALEPTSFTPEKFGYTFVGWRTDNSASNDTLNELVADNEGIKLYAVFKGTVTLSYSGNGSTGGSTIAQDKSQFYNNGNKSPVLFELKNNGFTKTGYTFSKWALGNANGKQYSAGEQVTIESNTTFVALWEAKSSYDVIGSSGNPSLLIGWGQQRIYDKNIGTIDLSGYSKIKLGAYYQVDSGGNNPTCELYVDGVRMIEGNDSSTSDTVATSPKEWTITSAYKKTCTLRLKASTEKCTKSAAVYAYVQLIK